MRLYNTPAKKIEPVVPLSPPKVTVYTCGPTVYDYPHIGNWFTFVRYDILVRALRADGLEPEWVMNVTDVGHLTSDADEGEDKLEKGAKREGKTAWEVAKFYGDYFEKGLNRLNILRPDKLPKATDHIAEQVELISALESKGFTYSTDDGVYFDTLKFAGYADFAKLNLSSQAAGARVHVNEQKRNPADFALWKFSPKDQTRDMEWDSPWGKGFPGWHLECSAMSMKYLGQTVDIHAGGVDHIPIHHTNEIAQSQAATGKQFVRHWMHANHILVGDKKIAKSESNGITLEEIEARGYPLEAFRLLVLESHYRTQSTFSWDALEAANNRLHAMYRMADLRWQPRPVGRWIGESLDIQMTKDALLNDLNTPLALAGLSGYSDLCESRLISSDDMPAFTQNLRVIDELFGLRLSGRKDIEPSQKELLVRREAARNAGDYATSDRLRDELAQLSIGVRDTQAGQIWYRI